MQPIDPIKSRRPPQVFRSPPARPRRPLAAALRLVSLFVVLTFVLPAASWSQAARYDGLPIREIEYFGNETLPTDTLDHYLFGSDRGEGRRLDLEALDENIQKLWERELIEDIEVEAEPMDGGVKLTVRLKERPILTSVEYVGMDRVSRNDILEAADKERVNVFEGQPLQFGELERLVEVIEDLYKEKGYRFAQVQYVLEDVGKGQERVVFTIDEGDKVKIGDIDFDGNTVFGDWRLRLTMKETKESGLISRFTKKDIYNPATIEEDLDNVRDLYKKQGYKDVLIADPELDVVAKNPQAPTIEEQKRRLAITIPIEEGERWKLGEVKVEGNEVFSDEILLTQFERPRGGWLRSKVIDEAVENISKLYSSVGYIFAQVETEMVERDPSEVEGGEENVVDVIVHVDEADQFTVGRIEFRGNTKTRDKVLRRELLLQEGRVMNMTGVQNSLLKIRQLNYFALDEEEPVKFDFDAEDKKVDLVIQGEEAERTELQFGGGWSEVDGFFGQFSMRTTNFLGRGETVGVSVQSGRQREFYDVEYRRPWLFDRPQSLGVRLFSQQFDSTVLTDTEFRSDFSGASLTYGRSFRGFQSFSVTYSFADREDFQSFFNPVDPDGDLITLDQTFTTSSLRPYWIRNTLDSRFEPTRGLKTAASLEWAGGTLGGDSAFVRPIFELTWFKLASRQPVQSSFGINVETGFIEDTELNDDGTPKIFPLQRFFLGGDNSVRGFDRRSIFVYDIVDGQRVIRRDAQGIPAGGDSFLQLNLEYHVVAGGPFRVVFFTDFGGVLADDQDFDTDLFRYSFGAEVRVRVPIFPAPLRFIYAVNPDELATDRFNEFDFSLSTSF